MDLTVKDIIKMLDGIAPFDLAEDWDNSGLQAGNPVWPVKKVLISLDITMEVMEEARSWEADMVLSHHPLLMRPEKKLDFSRMPGSAICLAARDTIAIVSAHTNLDKAIKGLNDHFAKIIGLGPLVPLVPSEPPQELAGIGRIGHLKASVRLRDLAEIVKNKLGIHSVRAAGDLDRNVQAIAVCTGSGGSLIGEFLNSPADLYITGDLKYHEVRLIEENNRAVIDVGHFASERIGIDLLQEHLAQAAKKQGYNLAIKGFTKEKDPFTIV